MESSIVDFFQQFCIPATQKLSFTYHMYTFLEHITVATYTESNSSIIQRTNISRAIVIMHNVC